MYSYIALAVLSVLAGVQQAAAVCGAGQMAVGTYQTAQWMGENSVQFYTGFLMDNNCNFIAESGTTEDWNAMCDDHHYNNGADVWCNNRVPVTAKDTVGQWWNCWGTNDGSCNRNAGGMQVITVEACCSRQ